MLRQRFSSLLTFALILLLILEVLAPAASAKPKFKILQRITGDQSDPAFVECHMAASAPHPAVKASMSTSLGLVGLACNRRLCRQRSAGEASPGSSPALR
jgi:hypothetical protein